MSESGSQNQRDDALVDLLVKQVTERLSAAERHQLDALDASWVNEQSLDFERAAAAVTLVGLKPVQPPAALQALLERQAEKHFAAGRVVDFRAPPAAATIVRDTWRGRGSRSGTLGWWAAAACLLLAVFGWFRSPSPTAPVPVVQNAPPPVLPPAQPLAPVAPPTAAEARAAMLARTDSLKVTLAPTKDPAATGVAGDVVWDPVSQEGFLHFVGLASNDPQVRQYQIWVFDGKRDKRYPVDAGVFDVPADAAEVVIPIHAALPIGLAKAFAVTVEKPGGVVVSALGHVVALGAAG